MRYEPLNYIYEYEFGAFAIFLVIMLHYVSTRRFPSQKSNMYSLIMWATVLDIILDVTSSLTIQYVFSVPLAITYIVNTAYYALTILMLLLMMLYTIALAKYIDRQQLRRIFPLLIPDIAVLLLLLTNPLNKLFFYVDPVKGYVHGKMFMLIYVTSFTYSLFTLIIVHRNRLSLRQQEYSTILVFLAVVFGATVAQYFVPSLLITGVAIMFAVGFMYFTIQNSETMVDITTGAFTYEAMLTFLQNRKQEQDHIQIVAIKIHNMSRINELLGIENGSMLLKQVCEYMRESCRDVWVFRMRGSCFVAITHKRKDYQILNKRMHNKVDQIWKVGNTEVLLQASVCSLASETLFDQPISPEDAVKLLETAFSKKNGSNERIRFITVDTEFIMKNNRLQAVESALRDALATGNGLELLFQPLWSVAEKRFTSAEVLLSFNHPTLGAVPPDEFVEIAECSGFVTELDEWVIRKSCELIVNNHFSRVGIKRLEINLSALEFMHRSLPKLLNSIMNQYSVQPSFLCFEITETATTESFEMLKDSMQKISDYGCSFALDDFGTGYANIAKVLGLPFSIIKLDKSLLYYSENVIADMSRMFNHMKRCVVVEGVETSQQALFCNSCSVDYVQGFYYAKPMKHKEFIEFMTKHGNQNKAYSLSMAQEDCI